MYLDCPIDRYILKDNDTWICAECDPYCAVCKNSSCVECLEDYYWVDERGRCVDKNYGPFVFFVSVVPFEPYYFDI